MAPEPQPPAGESLLEAISRDIDPWELLARQADALRRLEDVAETYLSRGEFNDAVATCSSASAFAEVNHPGVFASPRLEAVLEKISGSELPTEPRRARAADAKERVLIVVTETYGIGGHTRMVWRWIGRDPSRAYSVVTTAQRGLMPDGLRAAAAESGGEVFDVSAELPPLERAARLRALAADTDLIVLLDHPYDAIPQLALAGMADRPPIVMFNHGDHLFWLGRGIVDVLMCIRPAGVELALRRGFPRERVLTTTFPVSGPDGSGRDAREPLPPEQRSHARSAVLESLGWPSDTILLVTVGSWHKWEGPPGQRLLDVIQPVLAASPQARLVAAGTVDSGQWHQMRLRTGGRVAAAGALPNGVGGLLSAGDVFLDPMPIGGMAAPAEAAAHGLPVLAGAATETELPLIASEAAYGATRIAGHDAYRKLLTELIADPGMRHELGERARLKLAAADGAWEPSVERAFELARELGPVSETEFGPLPAPDEWDLLIDWMPTFRGKSTEAAATQLMFRELMVAQPRLRPLFASLEHRSVKHIARIHTVFAAPAPDAEALRALVAHFRLMSQFGLAERFLIALAPGEADQAIPVLEAAIADGAEIDIDLTLDPDPASVAPPGALVIT